MYKTLSSTILLFLLTLTISLGQTIYTDDDWTEGRIENGKLGYSVAVCGDYAAIGIPYDGNGKVWIFKFNGNSWDIKAILEASYSGTGLRFGTSVAITDSFVVVGAPGYSDDDYTERGAAFAFRKNGTEWTDQVGGVLLQSARPVDYGHFGQSLAMDGDWLVIGEPGGLNNNNEAIGAAYVLQYEWSNNTWYYTGWLTRSTGRTGDGFGSSVDISGLVCVIGAPYAEETGRVYIYDGTENYFGNMLDPTATLSNGHLSTEDMLGYSVAIENDTVVASALQADAIQVDGGSVMIFVKPQTGWADATAPNQILSVNYYTTGDNVKLMFGKSVDISHHVVAVGAPGYGQDSLGCVYVYDLSNQTAWTINENFILTAKNGSTGDFLGNAVALNGRQLVAGAPYYENDLGAAYIYIGPYVVQNPDSISGICGYDTIQFSARAVFARNFQWQTKAYDQDVFYDIADNQDFSGTHNDTLMVRVKPELNGHWFRCQFVNYQDTAISDSGIVWLEDEAPTVSLQAISHQYYLNAEGMAYPDLSHYATVSDNCDIDDTVLLNNVYQPIAGLNCEDAQSDSVTIHFKITDISGNSVIIMDQLKAYVSDTISPNFDCYDDFVQLDDNGQGDLIVENVIQNAEDNCQIADTIISKTHFTCADLGQVTDTVKVYDIFGNVRTKIFQVQVYDSWAPDVTISQDTFDIYLDSAGKANLPLEQIIISATDNCGIVDTIVDSITCMQVGGVIDWPIKFVDVSGNIRTVNAKIRVLDTIDVFYRLKDVGAFLPADKNYLVLNPWDFIDTLWDNCPIADIVLSYDTVKCDFIPDGTNKADSAIAVSIVDVAHDTITDSAMVIAFDTVRPKAYFHADTVYLGPNGYNIVDMYEQIDSVKDNCGVYYAYYIYHITEARCSDLGLFQGIYLVMDVHNNSWSYRVPVYIMDSIRPYIKVTDQIVDLYLPASDSLWIDPEDFLDSAWDNCHYQLFTQPEYLTCNEVGSGNMLIFIQDSSGNMAFDTLSYVLHDTNTLTLNCESYYREANAQGYYTVQEGELLPAITGCYDELWNDLNGQSSLTGEQLPVGTYRINWYAVKGVDTISCQMVVYVAEFTNIANNSLPVRIYPNPAGDYLIVESGLDKPSEIRLYDATGRCLRIEQGTSDRQRLNLRDLAAGVYWLQIKTTERIYTLKLIKR